VNAKQAALFASVVAAATLTASTGNAAAPATPAQVTAMPISHTYIIESYELIDVSRFEDGWMKYTPTGFLVLSAADSATATTASGRK